VRGYIRSGVVNGGGAMAGEREDGGIGRDGAARGLE